MGFFQDLKQDLSQAVNEMVPEDAETEQGDVTARAEATSSEDLFGQTDGEEFADLEAMLDNEAAALGADTAAVQEPVQETVQQPEVEPEQANDEVEELLNEVELNLSDQASSMEKKTEPDFRSTREPSFYNNTTETSSDTAVITAGMTITGDVISSGNMDLIGSINGKLNITGNINGNSSAAEIYAESAQINGEVKSKGSVKIGQSSVVIGNIFATSAVIAGAVKGDIDVHGPVILDTSAIVMGNIKSKSVQINNGAVIEGMCSQCYAEVSPTSFFSDVKKNRK